jgi:hypothetical protein
VPNGSQTPRYGRFMPGPGAEHTLRLNVDGTCGAQTGYVQLYQSITGKAEELVGKMSDEVGRTRLLCSVSTSALSVCSSLLALQASFGFHRKRFPVFHHCHAMPCHPS